MCKMIIFPGVFFHFLKILIFWAIPEVKGQEMTQIDKFCVVLHNSGTIHHMIVLYSTQV